MNSIMTNFWPGFQMYQSLRSQLMETISDADLRYNPGGANRTLGALCRQIGEVEHTYIQSFKTFTVDFSYRNPEPGLDQSVAKLVAWFAQLDAELQSVIEALSEEDIQQRIMQRSSDFRLPLPMHLYVYQEALLIFYGKADVHLKALGKALPEQWSDWID